MLIKIPNVSQGVTPVLCPVVSHPATLNGQFTHHQKYIFSLLHAELFINAHSFGVSCLVLKISAVETEVSVSRNPDAVTQDNPQTLL